MKFYICIISILIASSFSFAEADQQIHLPTGETIKISENAPALLVFNKDEKLAYLSIECSDETAHRRIENSFYDWKDSVRINKKIHVEHRENGNLVTIMAFNESSSTPIWSTSVDRSSGCEFSDL